MRGLGDIGEVIMKKIIFVFIVAFFCGLFFLNDTKAKEDTFGTFAPMEIDEFKEREFNPLANTVLELEARVEALECELEQMIRRLKKLELDDELEEIDPYDLE